MLTKDQLVDRRIVERNIQRGLLTEAEHKKYIGSLADSASKCTSVDYAAEPVGDADADAEE